jgi:hypothetical protein
MSWPGYDGGSKAPHDSIKALPGKGIIVRRHHEYDNYSRALANTSTPGETNRRGVIQTELVGTCDPKYRGDSRWYFWPDADDVVLEALANYYRPILAKYRIPATGVPFVAYPKSYGLGASQRMTPAEFARFEGICGHQHAPENTHGDPGAFPIARYITFLQEEDMPLTAAEKKEIATLAGTEVWTRPVYDAAGNMVTVGAALGQVFRDSAATLEITKALALKGGALTAAEIEAAVERALDAKIADATTILGVRPEGDAP